MRKFLNKHKKIKLLLILLIITLTITSIFREINNKVLPFFQNYAIAKSEQIALEAINNSVNKNTLEYVKQEEMFTLSKDSDGNIITIDYNGYNINNFLNEITDKIGKDLKMLEDDIAFYMPIGLITNNVFFNNRGYKIPVKIQVVGYVNTNVLTKVEEYGINNALITLYILIDVDVKVVLPFTDTNIKVNNEIPISYKLVQGSVPNFYSNGIKKNSGIYSIPLQ